MTERIGLERALHSVNTGVKKRLDSPQKSLDSSIKEKQGTVCLEDGDRKNWVRKGTTVDT